MGRMRMSILMRRKPDEEVANLINLANLCATMYCLPGPGGLLDQDSYLINGIMLVLQVQGEKAEADAKATKSKQPQSRLH